eukprot:COSAG01_NODE_4879_length_4656_cov_5.636384_4_plen_142_part_00
MCVCVCVQVTDYKKVDIFAGLKDDSVDAVFDNYAGNGTADRAMPKLRAGGTYLLLPDGDSKAGLSKHPKPGVRQINFGDVDQTHHTTLDEIAAMFEAGSLRIDVAGSGISGVQARVRFAHAASAYTTVAGGDVLGKISVVP